MTNNTLRKRIHWISKAFDLTRTWWISRQHSKFTDKWTKATKQATRTWSSGRFRADTAKSNWEEALMAKTTSQSQITWLLRATTLSRHLISKAALELDKLKRPIKSSTRISSLNCQTLIWTPHLKMMIKPPSTCLTCRLNPSCPKWTELHQDYAR